MIVTPGATSQNITVQIVDDVGLPVTGLVALTFPPTYYERSGAAQVAIALVDLALITSPYSSGGVKEISGGYYRLDVPNAAFTNASQVRLIGEAANKRLISEMITVLELAQAAQDEIAAAVLAALGANVRALATPGGTISPIYIGDDYLDADGAAIPFPFAALAQPDITGASIELALDQTVEGAVTRMFTFAGAVVTGSATLAQEAMVELTKAQTSTLVAGTYSSYLIVTLLNGDVRTMASGKFVVFKR